MSDLRSDMQNRETYVGDGVYASYNGGMIKLRTERDGRNEVIWLEPDTFDGVLRFARQFWTFDPNINTGH